MNNTVKKAKLDSTKYHSYTTLVQTLGGKGKLANVICSGRMRPQVGTVLFDNKRYLSKHRGYIKVYNYKDGSVEKVYAS